MYSTRNNNIDLFTLFFSTKSKIVMTLVYTIDVFAEGDGEKERGWKNLSYKRAMAPFWPGYQISINIHSHPVLSFSCNTLFLILIGLVMEEARINEEWFKLIRGRAYMIHIRRGSPFSRGRHRSCFLSRRRWNIPLVVV